MPGAVTSQPGYRLTRHLACVASRSTPSAERYLTPRLLGQILGRIERLACHHLSFKSVV